MVQLRLAAIATCLLPLACSASFPTLSLATQMRIDRETHLDEAPSGEARADDLAVRIVSDHGMCSGVVVSDAMVLTAQHCVTGRTPDGVWTAMPGDVRIELGGAPLPWGRLGVRHIERCEGYDFVHAPSDVAVLVLTSRLPEDMPAARIRLGGARDGEHVHALGYGTGSRVWTMDDPEGGSSVVAFDTARTARAGAIVWSTDDSFATSFASAHGDSGGPILSDDGEVIGVASLKVETDDDTHATIGATLEPCSAAVERARMWEDSVPRLKP